ncbi:FtsQ-type POTRA domain-containing protein [bacterium]|nr:MAG: FtsQ-type POTRA domain-containing protein [bacterium]
MTRRQKGKPLSKSTMKRKSPVKRRASRRSIREKATRTWWILRGVLAGLLLVALVYGSWIGINEIVRHPSLAVKQIIVEGCEGTTPDRIMKISGVRKGMPLVLVRIQEIRERVVSHPSVRDAVVVRQLPDTIRIQVKERQVSAVVVGPGFTLVDEQGVALSTSARYPGGYPLISGISGKWSPGDRIIEALPALGLLNELTAKGLLGADKISEISLQEDRQVKVFLTEAGTTLILSPDHPDKELERLGKFMASNSFETGAAGYDLRFEGRVIRLPERDQMQERLSAPRTGGSRNGQG